MTVKLAPPDVIGSPEWWLARLLDRLALQSSRAAVLDTYYRGEQGIPVTATKAVRQAYQRLMALARTNFAELIVEAVRERMSVAGFRTGASDDPAGDARAWQLWQANALDADADLVHRAKLSMGVSYVIVGRDDPSGEVLITPEDPRQVVAELDPIRRRKVRAALKVFYDDLEGVDRAFLYLPGRVHKARRPVSNVVAPSPGAPRPPVALSMEGWEWDGAEAEALPVPADQSVPVIPFLNRPDLYSMPQGEFESHMALLDRINYTILNRLEVATLQAFRQRAVKGVPLTDETGNEVDYDDVFAADPGALWVLPDTAELWESGQVDLGPIRAAIHDDVEQLAAVSRTPMHYFAPGGANQSAEGAALAREALVFKTYDGLKHTGESWEAVMSQAFLLDGDERRARRADMEILWDAPERYSLAERADAASKATASGVPWRTVMRKIWQFSPQAIERMEAERFTDAFNAALAQPAAIPSVPSEPPRGPQGPAGAAGGVTGAGR